MDFIKKHYEKIILALVLLGLAGAAAYLPFLVSSIRVELEESIRPTKPKEFQSKDLSEKIALLNRAKNPKSAIVAGPEHNTFNPVGWLDNNGTLVKDRFYGRKGPNALKIIQTNPLYLRIAFNADKEIKEENPRYSFAVTREAAEKKSERRKVTRFARLRDKNDIFILKEVKGNPLKPYGFVLELLESNQAITVEALQPFTEVTGFKADLEYPAAKPRKFTSQRKGDKISIEKRNYKVVFVSETEVVLSDEKTSKHTTITSGLISN
jgi:hypothetical protein